MEVKLNTENTEKYYKDLLAKIREIRKSDFEPRQKIKSLLSLCADFDDSDPTCKLSDAVKSMSRLDDNALQRLFNCFYLLAESYACNNSELDIKNACEYIIDNVELIIENPDIYTFTCYGADFTKYEDEDGKLKSFVSMPKELRGFKGKNMVLKIMGMDRFIDTFSNCSGYYRRAYSILTELDQHVLDGLTDNDFEPWEFIEYKDDGYVLFEFSHFEVNTNEPDEEYRTLYVVYRYETTISK